jgi:hypothetical protein
MDHRLDREEVKESPSTKEMGMMRKDLFFVLSLPPEILKLTLWGSPRPLRAAHGTHSAAFRGGPILTASKRTR